MSHEVDDELASGVAIRNAMLLEDLIGDVGAGLERKFLREDEGVVAIEEKGCDLKEVGRLLSA